MFRRSCFRVDDYKTATAELKTLIECVRYQNTPPLPTMFDVFGAFLPLDAVCAGFEPICDAGRIDSMHTSSVFEKRDLLVQRLAEYGRVAVAFSAGVDSTVVAMAAHVACGENAIAITAASPSLASGELEQAKELALRIGIRHQIVNTEEFANDDYRRNQPNRCYFCKTTLYDVIQNLRPELKVDVVVNGANLDDCGDHRPGMVAADEHGVRSPLIETGFTKADVRELASEWDLPVADKPAMPCLSSRIAYGVEVTVERVRRVDAAERYLRDEFDLRELRVRHEANELARVEVPSIDIDRLIPRRSEIVDRLRSLGFRYATIDLDGFRSGSMNDVVALTDLRIRGT